MYQLRSKIMGSDKIKTINGTEVNGKLLFNLLESYVSTLNKGDIPVIENTWSYICRNENQSKLKQSMELFADQVREKVEGEIPMDSDLISIVFGEIR